MKTVHCILEWSATPYCSHRPSCRIARVCDCGVAGDGSLSCSRVSRVESRLTSPRMSESTVGTVGRVTRVCLMIYRKSRNKESNIEQVSGS